MKGRRTTAGGIVTAIGAIATFVGYWVTHGVPPVEAWGVLGTALGAAAIGIFSADSTKAGS